MNTDTTEFTEYDQVRKENTWTIYTKHNCIYCVKIKQFLGQSSDIITINCDSQLISQEIKLLYLYF